MSKKISFTLNNKNIKIAVEENWSLLFLLREKLKFKGTKEGCGSGECGACTVIINGKAINSCIYLAIEINNKKLTTIEGLTNKTKNINILQKSFIENGGVQCGFCTPGMLMSSKALLDQNDNPSEKEIKETISGNICRCTGYSQIITSIKEASKKYKNQK